MYGCIAEGSWRKVVADAEVIAKPENSFAPSNVRHVGQVRPFEEPKPLVLYAHTTSIRARRKLDRIVTAMKTSRAAHHDVAHDVPLADAASGGARERACGCRIAATAADIDGNTFGVARASSDELAATGSAGARLDGIGRGTRAARVRKYRVGRGVDRAAERGAVRVAGA
jgi:hypothetical protein